MISRAAPAKTSRLSERGSNRRIIGDVPDFPAPGGEVVAGDQVAG